MKKTNEQIYLGTVLLELNRWGKENRKPSFLVSDWTQRIADDGFDGLELWQDHALMADAEELERLRTGVSPVKIFNAYDVCESETLPARRRIAEFARLLGAEGMKFNTGKDPERHETYLHNLVEWREMFPPGFRMLCECHRGCTMQDPDQASRSLDKIGRRNFGMIIHGLDNDEATVRERFAAYGDRITHIHGNVSGKGMMTEDALRRRIDLLRELGFNGTYTIEFTEGIRDENMTIEDLYRNAVRDLKLLRKCLEN